jgi:hypothetical protein
MSDLVSGDLTVEVHRSPGVLRLVWLGKSNERYPKKVLGPFFDEVFAEVDGTKASVEMRFEALDYLNSSTISTLVGVIRDMRERGIKLAISFDETQKWQKLCFEALRVFEKPDGLLVLKGR